MEPQKLVDQHFLGHESEERVTIPPSSQFWPKTQHSGYPPSCCDANRHRGHSHDSLTIQSAFSSLDIESFQCSGTQLPGHGDFKPTYADGLFTEPMDYFGNPERPFPVLPTPITANPLPGQVDPSQALGCMELQHVFHDTFPKLLTRVFDLLRRLPDDTASKLHNIADLPKLFSACRVFELVILGHRKSTPQDVLTITYLRLAFNTCFDRRNAPNKPAATPGRPHPCVHGIEDQGDKEAVFILLDYLFAEPLSPQDLVDWLERRSVHPESSYDSEVSYDPLKRPFTGLGDSSDSKFWVDLLKCLQTYPGDSHDSGVWLDSPSQLQSASKSITVLKHLVGRTVS
jgi:hypothetical protein